ncbi:MAG: hypothetical protein V7K71_02535 [Nostoc sp.]|uniref:hypothetical protein n=1 Tax=Nostoc sp. TaxID=1180 RepID=UPI002FFD4B6E
MLELTIYKSIIVAELAVSDFHPTGEAYNGHLHDRHPCISGALAMEDRRYSESSAVEGLQNL